MDVGHFYFLSDKYFIDFPDKYLMQIMKWSTVFHITARVFTLSKTKRPAFIG